MRMTKLFSDGWSANLKKQDNKNDCTENKRWLPKPNLYTLVINKLESLGYKVYRSDDAHD